MPRVRLFKTGSRFSSMEKEPGPAPSLQAGVGSVVLSGHAPAGSAAARLGTRPLSPSNADRVGGGLSPLPFWQLGRVLGGIGLHHRRWSVAAPAGGLLAYLGPLGSSFDSRGPRLRSPRSPPPPGSHLDHLARSGESPNEGRKRPAHSRVDERQSGRSAGRSCL